MSKLMKFINVTLTLHCSYTFSCQTWTNLALLATLYSTGLVNHMTGEIRCWESDPVMEKYECYGHQGVTKVMTLTETLWPLVWTWTYIEYNNLWPPTQVHSFFLNMKLISFKWRDKLHTLGYAVYYNMTQLVISIAWDIQSFCTVIKWKVYIGFFFLYNSTVWTAITKRRRLKWCAKNVTLCTLNTNVLPPLRQSSLICFF